MLLIAEEGPLRAAIESELREAGVPTKVTPADHDHLWLEANGHEAVVYLPSGSLLDGHLVAAAVREAIHTEQQGRVSEVEAESSDVATLIQSAAEAALPASR